MASVTEDSLHPLFVVNILSSDVGGDISTNGVTVSSSTVRIKFSTHIAISDVDLGKVSPTMGQSDPLHQSRKEILTPEPGRIMGS